MQEITPSTNRIEVLARNRRTKSSGEKRRASVSKFISGIASDMSLPSEELLVLTTGSDSRDENKSHDGEVSNMEFEIIGRGDVSIEVTRSNIDRIQSMIQSRAAFTIDNINSRVLGEDSMVLYANNPHLVFPTRIWDAVPFFGDPSMADRIHRAVIQETSAIPGYIRSFKKRMDNHRRITFSGKEIFKGEEKRLFNFETGVVNYDPNNAILGVKSGPLRFIQYTLALALYRKIRESEWTFPTSEIQKIPKNIVDRLEYLSQSGLTDLPSGTVSELQYIYAFFLGLYHDVQYKHFSFGDTEYVIHDPNVLIDIRDMLEMLREVLIPERFFPSKETVFA